LTLISWKALQPERFRRAVERLNASMPKSKKKAPKKQSSVARPGGGRAGKDALMPQARKVAAAGSCSGWNDVLDVMRGSGIDTASLSIWASAGDKDEIDRICARTRAAMPLQRR
jgi:hypothetical protein